jgi:hypothetical protein
MKNTINLSREQAIELANSKWWEMIPEKEVAMIQLCTPLLCMPFDLFHKSVECATGRPVFTHEFANPDGLWDEIIGKKPEPSLEEIINMIPEDKRIVLNLVSFEYLGC